MLVCTLGDLTLDVVVRLSGPIARGGDTPATIRVGPGGQAGNVAAWAATLGANARFIGKTGDDDAGRLARTKLGSFGVEVVGPVTGRNGTICSLVSPGGERSMASDRGSATDLRAEEVDPQWLAGCDTLHVSGYALMVEPVRSAALHIAGLARAAGAQVCVDLASWSAIQDSGVEAFRDAVRGVDPNVVFANENEERMVGRFLTDAVWILKRGARGCSFDGGRASRPPRRTGRRLDGCGRRAGSGLDRRRPGAGAGSRGALRPAPRRDPRVASEA